MDSKNSSNQIIGHFGWTSTSAPVWGEIAQKNRNSNPANSFRQTSRQLHATTLKSRMITGRMMFQQDFPNYTPPLSRTTQSCLPSYEGNSIAYMPKCT